MASFKQLYNTNEGDVCKNCNLYNYGKDPKIYSFEDKIFFLYSCVHCEQDYILIKHNVNKSVERLINSFSHKE